MNEPAIAQPHAIQDPDNDKLTWTLKAGVWYCFVEGYKIFELKQGVGKWTINGLGKVHQRDVPLDPEVAKAYALEWFKTECRYLLVCLS